MINFRALSNFCSPVAYFLNMSLVPFFVLRSVHGFSAVLDIASRYNRNELFKAKTHLKKNMLQEILSELSIVSIENENVAAQNLM